MALPRHREKARLAGGAGPPESLELQGDAIDVQPLEVEERDGSCTSVTNGPLSAQRANILGSVYKLALPGFSVEPYRGRGCA